MFSMTKVMISLPTSLLIFLAIELMVMDPTQFRERFKAWKDGKKPYKDGLPAYAGGTEPNIDRAIDFLKLYEGFKDTTYTDGNGIPTIGYGFTDSALVKKGKISRAEADARLKQEVINREAFLSKLANWDKLTEGSKTALRSYYYNYPAGFKDTTKFMKAWNSGNYKEAIRQVDAGWNDTKNPGLRKRRQLELALLMADPFLMQRPPAQSMSPIVEQPVSTNVRQVIPEEQTRARWTGTENVSPYVTGKPMVKLQPVVKMPNLIEIVEDSLWLPGFKNGKLPKFKDGKDDDFESFRQTLPDNQKNTPEYMYRTRRYWELNGKPKNFGEAIGRGMYTYEGDGWHANSVSYNENTGEYEFMKPNYHNTKMMEDAWYYSKEGEEFRNQYTKSVDPTGIYDKYIPKKKKGLIGLKNGKLPRYNTGLVPGLTEERSDNTRVARQEVHLPVKRQLLKKLVTTELMLLATENKPVVKLDNYTRKRVAEESNKRTWRSDVADQLHNLGEASLLASNFVPFEGQMLEGANWMAQTAKSYLTHPFYKTVYHGSPYPFNIKNAWTATANDLGLHVGSKQTAATMADKSGVVYKLRIPKENTLTIDMGSNGAQQLSDSFFMPAQSKQFPNSYYDTTLGDDFRILMLKDAGAEPSVVGNRLYTENTVMLPIRSKVYPNISEKYMRDIHELRRQTLMNTDGITRRPIDMNLQMRLNQQANDILRDSGYKVIKYHNANPYEGGGTAYMITDPSVMDVLPNMPKLKPLMWPIGTDAAYISTK